MSQTGRWGDLAVWKGPTPYQDGPMVEQRGVVIHIAEGYLQGTLDWMSSPNNTQKSSAHFIVDKDGTAYQVIEVDVTAYTQVAGNGHWISIENCGFSGDLLTDAQLEFNAQVLARAHTVYGAPLMLATSPAGYGLGHHSMGGVPWGDHPDCPGSPIINQKQAIVNRALAIVNGGSPMSGFTPDDAKQMWQSGQINNDKPEAPAKESVATTLQRMRQDLDDMRAMFKTLPADIAAAMMTAMAVPSNPPPSLPPTV